jgi:lysyl-tRNA synthetase class 2
VNNQQWAPSATIQTWRARQGLIEQIRSFFMERAVLEVDVPTLSQAIGTDPHLDFYETRFEIGGAPHISSESGLRRFLTTSPEFHLKRLLAAGFPDIFYLGKAFRNGEAGDRHNGEFTILEWYRIGWDWDQLMEEVLNLCAILAQKSNSPAATLARKPVRKITWQNAYKVHCGFDPLDSSLSEIENCAERLGLSPFPGASREDWLDLLMGTVIETKLGRQGPEFLTHYPPAQAALAQIEEMPDGTHWARRFELYWDGIELCNGYQELCDPMEQRQRFEQDIQHRELLGKVNPVLDMHFLAALEQGLPACSGVALGIDRLAMLLLGKNTIRDVLLFPDARA